MTKPIAITGGLFIAYAGGSLAWAVSPDPFVVANFVSLVGAFWLGSRSDYPDDWWFWLCMTVCGLTVAYGFIQFVNPNIMGCIIVMAMAGALTYDWLILLPIYLVGLGITESRGAISAASGICLTALWKKYPRTAVSIAVIAIGLVIWQKPLGLSLYQRLGIWQDTLEHLSFFGAGLGSFHEFYNSISPHRNMFMWDTNHPYNDVLELLAMFGIGVLPLWAFLALCLDRTGPKLPLLAFALLGLTYYPLSIIPCAQAAAFSLGVLAKGYAIRRPLTLIRES